MSKSGQPATKADQGGQRPAKAPKDKTTGGSKTANQGQPGGEVRATTPATGKVKKK